MRSQNRPFRSIAGAALAMCLLAGATVEAAPLDADGKPTIDSAASGDTPAGREFRAGIQAQLKGDMAAARARFEAALKIDPNYAPALIGLAGVAQAVSQGHAYFSFGISTELDGTVLNDGLQVFKLKFGASGVVHETYSMSL
jgi:Tfp pilus assembly protein PilF